MPNPNQIPTPAPQNTSQPVTPAGSVPRTNPQSAPLAPPIKQPVIKAPLGSSRKNKSGSTQKNLLISEIRDGMVIMKDGSMRSVVMCQSINFDLMSPQEREGIEYSYQGFLNSLYFPVQIFIRSQRVNLDGYIEKLGQIRQNQDNILLGLLMEDYIEYVQYLIEAANIMDKQFYIVVPYYPSLASKEGIATGAQKFSELFKPKKSDTITINEVDFRKYKQELTQQVRVVSGGLNQLGVRAIPLNTQELIELYYNVYNPVTAKNEPLTDVTQLEASIIEKGEGDAPKILPGGGV